MATQLSGDSYRKVSKYLRPIKKANTDRVKRIRIHLLKTLTAQGNWILENTGIYFIILHSLGRYRWKLGSAMVHGPDLAYNQVIQLGQFRSTLSQQ